jgi:hypothetical protein
MCFNSVQYTHQRKDNTTKKKKRKAERRNKENKLLGKEK